MADRPMVCSRLPMQSKSSWQEQVNKAFGLVSRDTQDKMIIYGKSKQP